MMMSPTTNYIEPILMLLDHNVTHGFSFTSGAAPVDDAIFQLPTFTLLVPF